MAQSFPFLKLHYFEKRGWILLVFVVASTHLFIQSLMLPYRDALRSLMPHNELPVDGNNSSLFRQSFSVSLNRDPLSNSVDVIDASWFSGLGKGMHSYGLTGKIGHAVEAGNNITSEGNDPDDSDFVEDANMDNDLPFEEAVDVDGSAFEHKIQNQDHSLVSVKADETRQGILPQQILRPNTRLLPQERRYWFSAIKPPAVVSKPVDSSMNTTLKNTASFEIDSATQFSKSAVEENLKITPTDKYHAPLKSDAYISNDGSSRTSNPTKRKMRCEMPPKSRMLIYEMNQLLLHNRRRSHAMKPRWSSVRDQDILAAKLQILNAPFLKNDREIYAPLFRNVSMFKRSYQLMERLLKVYVYKDGEKPIFHQPILKGLYASEGWFMKLMEGNKQFTVNDPRKAHLFYMPFSSRMLEFSLYVRNSHNRTNLRQYLKDYSEKIAAKYPFFNRSGGADHVLVACHDWAPYEIKNHMDHCIKALCNADVTQGFKIGRDVSLPETYVRSARNPLRDLGGKPPSERLILAFYAGSMHGYLRRILLKYWLNKDPDLKIFGPMPPGVASKMNYIQHMKSSKFCICPKGYEVNSPRVVEAIFYECVPVIISDNFVPPFFEVLNWDAFSIILAEKDIPNLKNILLSVPEKKYLELQQGVRKVQQHFLWHPKPKKYDLFHMTLHSIWYNRVFQIKPR